MNTGCSPNIRILEIGTINNSLQSRLLGQTAKIRNIIIGYLRKLITMDEVSSGHACVRHSTLASMVGMPNLIPTILLLVLLGFLLKWIDEGIKHLGHLGVGFGKRLSIRSLIVTALAGDSGSIIAYLCDGRLDFVLGGAFISAVGGLVYCAVLPRERFWKSECRLNEILAGLVCGCLMTGVAVILICTNSMLLQRPFELAVILVGAVIGSILGMAICVLGLGNFAVTFVVLAGVGAVVEVCSYSFIVIHMQEGLSPSNGLFVGRGFIGALIGGCFTTVVVKRILVIEGTWKVGGVGITNFSSGSCGVGKQGRFRILAEEGIWCLICTSIILPPWLCTFYCL